MVTDNAGTEVSNCAFQYATVDKIYENRSAITQSEAKKLWQQYLERFKDHTKEGVHPEMCIWGNMANVEDYHTKIDYLHDCKVIDGALYTRV